MEDIAFGAGTQTVDVMGVGPVALTEVNIGAIGGSVTSVADGALIGTVDGVNSIFTIPGYPSNVFHVMIFLNGLLLTSGTGYTRANDTVTFLAGYIPQVGYLVRYTVFYNS